MQPPQIDAQELSRKLAAASKPVVLDVRQPQEVQAEGIIAGSLHIPMNEVPARLAEVPREGELGADLGWALLACAVILPPFTLAFSWFVRELPRLPPELATRLAPYVGAAHPLRFRLGPDWWDLGGRVAGNAAVAFSEEFFYRGYMTLRLEQRWPPAARILGAPMGRAAVLTAALFAVGPLLEPAPWRLPVFFPALTFAWLRART